MATRCAGVAVVVTLIAVVMAASARGDVRSSGVVRAAAPPGRLVTDGYVAIQFHAWALDVLGWGFVGDGVAEEVPEERLFTLAIEPKSTLQVDAVDGVSAAVAGSVVRTRGALLLTGPEARIVLGNLAVEVGADGVWTVTDTLGDSGVRQPVFDISTARSDFSESDGNLRMVGELSITESWADYLGVPDAAGIIIGVITMDVDVTPSGRTARVRGATEGQERAECRRDTTGDEGGGAAGMMGPDIVIADLQSISRHGRVGDITAYSVGTNACNLGDMRASWISYNNRHPAIAGCMYRLKDGRFEQIGMSWIKHGFYAISGSLCGPCNDPTNGSQLGVGCSDPYSAYLNGVQNNMSRRSDVNAHTGYFPYPWTAPQPEPTIGKRLQVHDVDLDPELNVGALYFVQGQYVAADENSYGNGNNSSSYRQVTVRESSPTVYEVDRHGQTQRGQAAIRAWKDTDPTVMERDVQVPDEGLFILSAQATEMGGGNWHYEYALQNVNSDRSAGYFSVPLPQGSVVTNIGFHDVDYHSGEIYDLTDWPAHLETGAITWSTDSHESNPNANALRWGTLYNFRFDTAVPPGEASVTIGLFKPGAPREVVVRTTGPSFEAADCNNNGVPDACDLTCGLDCDPPCGQSADCNENGIPDECEPDCNKNGVADACDIEGGLSGDCNDNTVPDECEPDCDRDGIPDDCEVVLDSDGDGVDDCLDLCPETTPAGACVCPESGWCCFRSGLCIPDYSRGACIAQGGTPDCIESPCRDGCLVGDFDRDGDRDLRDYAAFQGCFSGHTNGPGFVMPSAECRLRFDYEEDTDVDHVDFKEFCSTHDGP